MTKTQHQLALDVAPNCGPTPTEDAGYLASVRADWKPAQPTKVFAAYWYLAAARQSMFFGRLRGEPPPWTADPILARHRFTNAYRARTGSAST